MKESEIYINQIGYRPQDTKTVLVGKNVRADGGQFTVYKKSEKNG